VAPAKVEGTVAVFENEKRYEARYECQDDIVIVYINDEGPFETQAGGLYPETVARMLLREFVDGRIGQGREE
jgi:hypothetical protein